MLQDFNCLSGPSCWSQVSIPRFLLMLGSPALDTMLPVFLTSAEGKDHLPKPAGNGLSNAVQKDVGLLATKAHWWLMVSLVSTGTSRASSVIWPLACAVVVIPPQVQDFTLLFECHEVPVSLFHCSAEVAQKLGVLTIHWQSWWAFTLSHHPGYEWRWSVLALGAHQLWPVSGLTYLWV